MELSVRPLIGTKRPIHSSAIGKAIIAFLDEPLRDDLLAVAELSPLTWRTITSPEVLKNHLAEVRARGYAIDDQESVAGVRCIAAPLLDRNQRPFAAIGISAPLVRLTDDRVSALCMLVRQTADRLSSSLWNERPVLQRE